MINDGTLDIINLELQLNAGTYLYKLNCLTGKRTARIGLGKEKIPASIHGIALSKEH